jgi:hypothetical protein
MGWGTNLLRGICPTNGGPVVRKSNSKIQARRVGMLIQKKLNAKTPKGQSPEVERDRDPISWYSRRFRNTRGLCRFLAFLPFGSFAFPCVF